jgi:aspartyl aminopeptidase
MPVIPGLPAAPEAATRLVQFVNASPTPFHAVHNAAVRLERAGFSKVCLHSSGRSTCLLSLCRSERKMTGEANLKDGGKYYFTR